MSHQPPAEAIAAAQACQTKYHLWASLQLAQGILESAWFTKETGKYNFFGVKAKNGTVTWTHEYVNGQSVRMSQNFANYDSMQEAFEAHAKLLTDPTGHYAKALPLIDNLEQYIRAIAPIYATDPHYADSLLNLIHSNQLYKYDVIGAENENA